MNDIKYIEGTMDIGSIAQFFLYLNMLIWPFTSLGWITMVVQRAEASMFRINEFLNLFNKSTTANIAFINCSECFFAHSRSSEMLKRYL